MLINLHMIGDSLSFAPGRHLLSDPVLRDLEKPEISTRAQLREDTVYVLDPRWLERGGEIPIGTKLFFCAPPPEDPRLNALDYLYAPVPMEPVELLQELYRVFARFNGWELNLHRALLKKDPLQALGDCSLDFLRNPAGLYTSSFFILRFWEKKVPGVEPFYQAEDKGAYICPEHANLLLMSSEFVDSWNTDGPQFLPAVDGDDFTCLYQNISLYGMKLARVVLNDHVYPYLDSDLPILDFFSQFVTRALMADSTPYLTAHPPYLDECLLKLAAGESYDEAGLNAAAVSFGWEPEDPYICARVLAPQDNSVGSIGHACMRLEALFKGSCVLRTDTDILMLVNLRTAGQSRDQVICSLPYVQRDYLMKIGYSYEFRDIRNLPVHYAQAGIALELGQEVDPHIWTYRFESYALRYGTRNAVGSLDAKSLCHPGLLKLLEYDREKGRNFANTLRVYLESNMSVTQTIRKVYLQRASFQYQLQKILEITDANLEDFDTRLHILLSFRLLDQEKDTE